MSKTFGSFEVLYDDEDHELVSQYHWYVSRFGKSYYALSSIWVDKKDKVLLMHRVIMGITDSKMLIDHKNRNGLDNRRCNLRIATRSQNSANQGVPITNSIGYKGVMRLKGTDKFLARIYINGKQAHLGTFKTAKEAAIAYNEMAIKTYGEFACINNVDYVPNN